ncbi:helix-hairpin-helix domain-containing protein [Gordonia aurantiaca]|uniref:helix-hairpin-helix domain-containing protein n=1 Tax=Gordonia sp. B21 TaxID=3151852 RepID=UPI00326599FF
MSASGRRNPLDRLGPVVEMPARPADAPLPSADPDPPVDVEGGSGAVVVEESEHPGWGIGGMPTWLAPEDSTGDRARGERRSSRRRPFDEVLDVDGQEREGFWDDDDPVPRRRFAIAPPGAIALIVVGVIACAVAAFGLFRGTDPAPVVDFGTPAGASAAPDVGTPGAGPSTAEPSAAGPAEVIVSVVGLVNEPGLVRLPSGARVAEAIERAGGARKGADLLSLNLAQVLRDGDQILVGYAGGEGRMSLKSAVVGASGAPAGGGAPAAQGGASAESGGAPPGSGASGDKVNLNTATEAELDALPGVGPVTAKAILAWRQRNGRFTSVDQLAEVDGIGPARLAKLRDHVTV